MATKIIYLDAGHGGTDTGAVSGSFIEKTLNLKVSNACKAYLANYDCIVIQNRVNDNTNTIIANMTKDAKDKGACVYVSIHHNAGNGDGCDVYYQTKNSTSKSLAKELVKQFKAIGQNTHSKKDDGLINGDAYKVCKFSTVYNIPAVMGEFAFIDNTTDRQIVDSDIELIKEGEAYAKAIINIFGITKKITPPTLITNHSSNNTVSNTSNTSGFNAGDKVKVNSNGLIYGTNNRFASWVYNTTLIVLGTPKGNRVIISSDGKNVTGAIEAKYLVKVTSTNPTTVTTKPTVSKPTPTIPTTKNGIKVGDKVHIISGSTDVNTKKKYAIWVYALTNYYDVISIDTKNDYVTFGKGKSVTGKTYASNCRKK